MNVAAGISVFEGIAIGKLKIYRREEARLVRASSRAWEEELVRFQEARREAAEQLLDLCGKARREAGEESAAILEIQQMMLEDEDYIHAVQELLHTQGTTAEYAVRAAGEQFAAAFAAMEDPYMQARSADVRDVSRRLAEILLGRSVHGPGGEEPFILAAEDLTPSETVQMDRSRLLGFVTRRGSPNSHTAILARTMGIPALMGVEFSEEWDGRSAVLDGYRSCLYVDPDEELLGELEARRLSDLERTARLRDLKKRPNVTLDGTEIQVCANAGSLRDVAQALQNDAQGIGLFRSEFLYLGRERPPTEDEQFAVYRQAAEDMSGRRVVIRTLDLGADKRADFLDLGWEENPALGLRGIRLCLARRQLFQEQLRAILRASAYGNVAMMFPMITSLSEVRQAKQCLAECREVLRARGIPVGTMEVGVMIETPAAALIADELAREVDFFSLGTNDLTQYVLAVDRQNPGLAPFWDACHPAVLKLVRMTVEAGHRQGRRVGICGDLGADPAMTETFLRMGVDELSVPPAAILLLRGHIRSLDLGGSAQTPAERE